MASKRTIAEITSSHEFSQQRPPRHANSVMPAFHENSTIIKSEDRTSPAIPSLSGNVSAEDADAQEDEEFEAQFNAEAEAASATEDRPIADTESKSAIDFDSIPTYQNKPITDFAINKEFKDGKPWLKPGADIADWFNYGFNEFTWQRYLDRQKETRNRFALQRPEFPRLQSIGTMLSGMGNDHIGMLQQRFGRPMGPPQQPFMPLPMLQQHMQAIRQQIPGMQQQQQQPPPMHPFMPPFRPASGSMPPPMQMQNNQNLMQMQSQNNNNSNQMLSLPGGGQQQTPQTIMVRTLQSPMNMQQQQQQQMMQPRIPFNPMGVRPMGPNLHPQMPSQFPPNANVNIVLSGQSPSSSPQQQQNASVMRPIGGEQPPPLPVGVPTNQPVGPPIINPSGPPGGGPRRHLTSLTG